MTKFNLSLAGAALGLVLAFMVGLHVLHNSEPEAPPLDPNCPQLLPQSCDRVRDSFSLARNLYVQGKYELCLAEVAKVHDIIPQYRNSRELQTFCEQGRDLVKQQRELEVKEKAAREALTAKIEAARRPASAGLYTCRRFALGSGSNFEDYLNEACNKDKPFAITPLGESRTDYDICCIAKGAPVAAKSRVHKH